jgi:hypothetical protein
MTIRRHSGLNTQFTGVRTSVNPGITGEFNNLTGLYSAKIVDNVDENFEGHVWVELLGQNRPSDKDSKEERHSYHKIRRPMPFGGNPEGTNFTNSYGAVFQPPTPGTEVLVGFTGQSQEGFLLGVMPIPTKNTQVPGLPIGQLEGSDGVGSVLDNSNNSDNTGDTYVRHPIANANTLQGVRLDGARGVGSSGSRRESPINVSGFLTAAGHSIVMDDGTTAFNEDRSLTPDKNRQPGKNNLIRIRSGSGAQILLNDSAGIVYIINQNGSGWIQLDSFGNVDIYAGGTISMRAESDINFYADGSFNVDADTVNIKARGGNGVKIESATGGTDIYSNKDFKVTTDTNGHIKATGNIRVTSSLIDLNGPRAATASKTTANNLTVNTGVKQSIGSRVPEHEPWGGHLVNESIVAAQAPNSTTNLTATDINLSNIDPRTTGPQ